MVTMAERSEPFSHDETFNAIAAQVESQQSLPNDAGSFEDERSLDPEIDLVAPSSDVGAALEAILMVAEQPVEVGLLAQICRPNRDSSSILSCSRIVQTRVFRTRTR